MGWGKPFSSKGWGTKLVKTAAPIAAAFIPGVGPLAAAGIGAGIGALGNKASGGGIGGAIKGGLLGGGASLLGGAGAFGTAAGTPLAGGAAGATQGSGLAGLFSGGGVGALTNSIGSGLSSASSLFGGGSSGGSGGGIMSSVGNLFSGGGAGSGGITELGNAMPWLSGGSSVGSGGLLSGVGSLAKYAMPAASIFSGFQKNSAINDMEENKLEAERRRMEQLQPYNVSGQAANTALAGKLTSGELGGKFNALDLSNDPVYQSELTEGQRALDRKSAAAGSVFSGAALKEAAKYSSDLAAQKQNEAYQRWLGQQKNTYDMYAGQSSQGINAASGVGDSYRSIGGITSGAIEERSNNINSSLSDLLSGNYGKKPVMIGNQIVYV